MPKKIISVSLPSRLLLKVRRLFEPILTNQETSVHSERVMIKARVVLQGLKNTPDIKTLLLPHENEVWSALRPLHISRIYFLHDLGKVLNPRPFWEKPHSLSPEERTEVNRHPVDGAVAISREFESIPLEMLSQALLKCAVDIVCCHHERWDGRGYPGRLRGEQIPFFARIATLIDVQDALRHSRVYKPARSADEVSALIRMESGRIFDPFLVKQLTGVFPEIERIDQKAERTGNIL